ncbi:unnamed protein product [Urochloa humidicola]
MDQLLPCRGSSAARRRWCRAAARPAAPAIGVSVAAALLLAVVLFGVRLTPSGGNHTSWIFDGGRDDVLKSGAGGPLATVPDPRDLTLGGLLSPDFNDSSCLSRYRAVLYRRPSLHAISSHLVSTLRRYESLHRQCGPGTPAYARSVERLRAARNASATPSSSSDCNYLVWNPIEGLGNRILSLTSGFLYALLTNRVLLVHSSGDDLNDLFCEPFPGSTWLLPRDEEFPIRDMDQFGLGHHESLGAVLGRGEDPGAAASPWLYAHLVHNYDAQDRRFFCDDVQAALRRVPWLVFHSDNYFAPALFLIPGHERELSLMFPRRDLVFHHLGRYLFHPSNTVWGMVMRYHDEYFDKADERVGIQVRTFGWAPISTDELYGQIVNCTQLEGILPVPSAGELVAANADGAQQPAKRKAVVVVSLHGEYSEKLREMYQKDNGSTTTGREVVSVYQPTHLGAQRSSEKEHNQQAFAEMVLLGFSDVVVTTAASTFGYVGQGLAGLRPWVLVSPVDGKAPDTPCRHAPTIEPCFHSPPNYDCRAKADGDTGRMMRHVRHCEDYPQGVQLVE